MNADNSKSNKADDQLDRYPFAEQIVTGLLTSYENGSESLIIGINGAWGMGKSTLLNFIKTELENKQKDKVIIFDFNPWLFSGQEQLQRKFFKELKLKISFWAKLQEKSGNLAEGIEKGQEVAELIKEIGEYTNGLLGKIGYGLAYLEEITGIFNENLGKAIGNTAKLMQGEEAKEKPINEIKEVIDKSLKKLDKKIYVFIDDLDRLSPTEITQIFQLIRLNANFANTVFFVAFDKEIVVNALQKEYQKNGENYLEKIIQVDYSLPEIPPLKIKEILFEKELKRYLQILDIQDIDSVIESLNGVWANGFKHYFKNLRDINRYINAIKLRLPSIYKEIDIADFLVLEAIRIFDYTTYEYVYKNKGLLTDFVGSKKYGDGFLTDARKNEINQELETLNSLTKEGSHYLVKNLFYLENMKQGNNFYANSLPQPFVNFSIAVADYFDRYFTLKLLPTDFSKEEISAFFEGTVSKKIEFLEKMIGKSPLADFANLIQKRIPIEPKENQISILKAYLELGSKYPLLYDSNFSWFCRNEIIDVARLSEGRGETLFRVLSEHYPNSYLKLHLISDLYFGIRDSKEKFDNHILRNSFLLEDFDEGEIKKEYMNTLLSVGRNLFEDIENNTYNNYTRDEMRWLYWIYSNEYATDFTTKFIAITKTDASFLSFTLNVIVFRDDAIKISLSEKHLHTPLTKEFIIKRVTEIEFKELIDDQQIKTYKFLQKVIENGFKENVYYHFDTLEELPSSR